MWVVLARRPRAVNALATRSAGLALVRRCMTTFAAVRWSLSEAAMRTSWSVLSAFGARTQDIGLLRCSRHTSYCVLPRKLTEPAGLHTADDQWHVDTPT